MDITIQPPVVLIHEHFSGGGQPAGSQPGALAAEGLAMLQAILTDFAAWGGVRTLATLDTRLAHVLLPADELVPVSAQDYPGSFTGLLERCTATLIIAPETNGLLNHLTAAAERAAVSVLGSSAASIAIAANKWEFYHRCTAAGLPVPPTWRVNSAGAARTARAAGFPLVLKPLLGAGCEGVRLINDLTELHAVVERLPPAAFLLQRYVDGAHASVSLLAARHAILPLSLNKQHIRVNGRFSYEGATTPFEHPRAAEAMALARRAASLVPGLAGYVGVDLVLTEEGCHLIEINPRLTTSYTAIRQTIRCNLAEAIWQACQHDRLPARVMLSGKVSVRKEAMDELADR